MLLLLLPPHQNARQRSEHTALHAKDIAARNEMDQAVMRERMEDKAWRAEKLALQRK